MNAQGEAKHMASFMAKNVCTKNLGLATKPINIDIEPSATHMRHITLQVNDTRGGVEGHKIIAHGYTYMR